ncbi:HWE histidine kinase domain-containing protein [Erythrobacter sp. NE805]|uniref:HWE histidine kinase domain-containing protein n=1 Tax=Erythrobacter sp. NE805 TaxID=3389875 RepID=UPI00396B3516
MSEAVQASETSGAITRLVEALPSTRHSGIVGLAATLGIFGLAWAARALLDSSLPPGFPYLTFFPAVVITAFFFGVRLGSLSALLCGLVAWYYFVPPIRSFTLEGAEVALGLYAFVVITDLVLIHGLQVANRQLRRERQISAELALAKEQIVEELERRAAERKAALDALRESEVKTLLATQTAGIGLWQWHIASNTVHWDSTMFRLYGLPQTADGAVHYDDYVASVLPEDAPEQERVLAETVAHCTESTREFRIRRGNDGQVRHLRAVEVARAGPDGTTEWVVGTNLDVTDEKNRESHVRLLLGEVNHRAKNLLAVVLSVARRTGGASHEEFMENFTARIHSLAEGQDLLVRSEWKGVDLEALVRAQLGHFKDMIPERIVFSGEPLALSSSAVQAIGMTIHELVTNASKYGALSTDAGRITLGWQRLAGEEGERFVMTWTETGGPPVVAPTHRGFGSIVTSDMLVASLNAEVEAGYAPEGFAWRLECAIEDIAEQDAP